MLSNRLIYALLGLVVLMLIGMIFSSWRVVLYPFLVIVGINILFGFTKELPGGKRPFLVAGPVVGLLIVLFVALDVISGGEPTGSTNYVLGMTPPMALYVIGFPVLIVLVGFLYALTFTNEDVEEVLEEKGIPAEGPDGSEGGAR